MQIFVVLRSGLYTSQINGEEKTAERCAVVAVREDEQDAKAIARDGVPGPAWVNSVTWVDVADTAAPSLEL